MRSRRDLISRLISEQNSSVTPCSLSMKISYTRFGDRPRIKRSRRQAPLCSTQVSISLRNSSGFVTTRSPGCGSTSCPLQIKKAQNGLLQTQVKIRRDSCKCKSARGHLIEATPGRNRLFFTHSCYRMYESTKTFTWQGASFPQQDPGW